MKYKLELCTLLIIEYLAFGACTTGGDPFPGITLPGHPEAINPKIYTNLPVEGAKSVVYKVSMAFPAERLTSFYDNEMKKMGYEPFTEDELASFQWEDFNAETGEWELTRKIPARYTASWVDSQRKTRIWLYVAYKYDGMNKDWKVNPLASYNMAKYFSLDGMPSSEKILSEFSYQEMSHESA